jgi:hypothetical protein
MRLEDLSKADQFCPHPGPDPYWNESAYFSFSIPQRKLHGIIYYFFRPNMNLLVGGPAIWDASGCHTWDCLYNDWQHIQAIPPQAQKYNFTAPNSLSVRVLEPVRRYQLRYDKLGCQIELEWTAIAAANEFAMEQHAYGASNEGRFHIEQIGRVQGVVRLRGETYPIDCFSLRDCSYGRRVLGTTLKGGYFWGVADERTAFHTQTKGKYGDEQVVGGFLLRDGKMGDLVSGTRRIIEPGRHTPAVWLLEAKDNLGREIQATCRTHSDLLFTGYPDIAITWSLLEVDLDGKKGWGDSQEFYPREDFRQLVRGAA